MNRDADEQSRCSHSVVAEVELGRVRAVSGIPILNDTEVTGESRR